MLDTIDTAPYLERKDPARFAGSRQALRDWLRGCASGSRARSIVANGGEALVDVAPFVDGFVVEGVFSIYDAGRRTYRATTDDERTWKLGAIARARAVAPRPVFSIEYADVGDVALSRWAAGRVDPPWLSPLRRGPRSQHRALSEPSRSPPGRDSLHISILFEYLETW